ncbi:methanogenesis marker 16 metalloprotein [Methanocalculus taiwanensis]|uniref:Methanogenesis marker 16 metalloprotein n=1 Tax=Methanocalculus taiwanensis TaxID=106207 RepID=A0ABD4TIS0_9EURY|nr:methanogenesis marker 16 metalloprotein [Methanocalculus taiwanensis]MCQ1538834.1 methanogenesis marker 16 metalloprotein [Methanocalculus taiwanensis]
MKTAQEINDRIRSGEAIVIPAHEFKKRVRNGERFTVEDVDVITCGTFGVMSGTYAVLTVPVAPPGTFRKAESLFLNGVPAYPGPCPNERLGLVDCIVYGTAQRDESYGGGHLFADLAAGKTIEVEAGADGRRYTDEITLSDCGFARLHTTRSAFKNYTAFLRREEGMLETIFSVTGLHGPCREISVSGCGEVNPVQNDPSLRSLAPGTPVLLNGTNGIITGTGTRSTPERPNLACSAGMDGMDPLMMGGFITSDGPECLTSVAAAIPVLDSQTLEGLMVLDEEILLPVADISDRQPIGESDYGRIWRGTDRGVRIYPEQCLDCTPCTARSICPAGAIGESFAIDRSLCLACGACASVCKGRVFSINLGTLDISGNEIPVTLRQSDRTRAERLCRNLAARIREGTFFLREGA